MCIRDRAERNPHGASDLALHHSPAPTHIMIAPVGCQQHDMQCWKCSRIHVPHKPTPMLMEIPYAVYFKVTYAPSVVTCVVLVQHCSYQTTKIITVPTNEKLL